MVTTCSSAPAGVVVSVKVNVPVGLVLVLRDTQEVRLVEAWTTYT